MWQATNNILMIRPAVFRLNEETGDNAFQDPSSDLKNSSGEAQKEFDDFVSVLREKGVNVTVFDAIAEADTPDALFPNNWISFHDDGRVCLYPMKAENRRRERREGLIDQISNELGLRVTEIIDFTEFEDHDSFLEGTGSLVLDRVSGKAYAALSERTDRLAVERFSEAMGYEAILFNAFDSAGTPIYHTNVVMCIGTAFAVICTDAISADEREMVLSNLRHGRREIIEISIDQLHNFAGNMLEVLDEEGRPLIVMSQRAKKSLEPEQITRLNTHGTIISPDLNTIETLGGGSARCMMCEIFLPKY